MGGNPLERIGIDACNRKRKQAVAIVGGVGSGKSTLMAGILGEAPVSFPAADSRGNGGGVGFGDGSEALVRGGRGEEARCLAGSINSAEGRGDDFRGAGGGGILKPGYRLGLGGDKGARCGGDDEEEEEGGEEGGALWEPAEGAGEGGLRAVKHTLGGSITARVPARGEQSLSQHRHRHQRRGLRRPDGMGGNKAKRRGGDDDIVGPPQTGAIVSPREGVRVCYAAQAPWVMSGTVRENVLFGLPMDQERYR